MRKLIALSLLGLSLPLTAIAQPPPPPPPPPPGGGGMAPGETIEPKLRLEAGLIIGIPQGDLEEGDTSPGIHIQLGYTVAPNISVFGGLRYISIQFDGAGEDVSFSHYDLNAGARYSMPVSPTAKLFGEAHLSFSTLSVDFMGSSDSESGIGFGIRGGGIFAVSPTIGIGAALGYSTASIEEVDDAWLTLEGFASFGF